MDLTDNQLSILYRIVEVHFKWFNLHTDAHISYEDCLKLNHQKLIDIADACDDCDEEVVNQIFEKIFLDYLKMLSD